MVMSGGGQEGGMQLASQVAEVTAKTKQFRQTIFIQKSRKKDLKFPTG